MKFTVLLALPNDIACDQCCEADKITRVHVEAETIETAIDLAAARAAAATAGYPPEGFAPVAVYAGHIMDIFQP